LSTRHIAIDMATQDVFARLSSQLLNLDDCDDDVQEVTTIGTIANHKDLLVHFNDICKTGKGVPMAFMFPQHSDGFVNKECMVLTYLEHINNDLIKNGEYSNSFCIVSKHKVPYYFFTVKLRHEDITATFYCVLFDRVKCAHYDYMTPIVFAMKNTEDAGVSAIAKHLTTITSDMESRPDSLRPDISSGSREGSGGGPENEWVYFMTRQYPSHMEIRILFGQKGSKCAQLMMIPIANEYAVKASVGVQTDEYHSAVEREGDTHYGVIICGSREQHHTLRRVHMYNSGLYHKQKVMDHMLTKLPTIPIVPAVAKYSNDLRAPGIDD